MLSVIFSLMVLVLLCVIMIKVMGGHSGYFEVWIIEYKLGTDPNMSYKVLESHPIHKRHGAVEVFGWLDHFEIVDRLQEIRNYNTGGVCLQ